jgi:Tol biopolymer transport system component
MVLEWPTIDKISIHTKTSGLSDGLAIVINPSNGEFYRVLGGIFGLNIKWSPLGNLLLYSSTSIEGKNPNLYVTDQTGQNKQALGINSITEKCVFSQDNRALFCAVPQTVSENAVWPDDYYKGMTATSDNFYKINLETGEKGLVFQPGENDKSYDAIDPFLSPKEDYLFFINRKDGMLYSLKIE